MYLPDHAWPHVGSLEGRVALVPLGSTEQHGPHLPLKTDHVIARELAREAADRSGAVCTPPVNVGVSPHHRQFPGTLSVDAPAFRDYVESLVRSLAYQDLRRVVFVNAHGGNVQHLREVGRRVRDSETAYAVEWMWNESIPGLVEELFPNPGPHAGPKETSMLLHLAPETVHKERLREARDGGLVDIEGSGFRRFGARVRYDAVENSRNGAFGDPTAASAEKGEQLFEAATEQLVKLVEWVEDQPFDALMPPARVDAAE